MAHAAASPNILVRRSALSIRTYLRWMQRFCGYALLFVVIGVIGVAIWDYYYVPSQQRQSLFAMKYIDANVFTNQRFGDDPYAIKPFTTGLQLDNGIQMVKSQVFCERIVENLGLNVSQYDVRAFGKRIDLYGIEPFAVAVDSIGSDTAVKATIDIAPGCKSVSVSQLTIDNEEVPTSGKALAIGGDHTVKVGPLKIIAADNLQDYDGYTIEVALTPVKTVASNLSKRLNVVQTAAFTDVLTCTYSDISAKRADDILNQIPVVYDQIWRGWNDSDASKFVDAVDSRLAVYTEALEAKEKEIEKQQESSNTASNTLAYRDLVKQRSADAYSLNEVETQIEATRAVARQLAADHHSDDAIAAATSIMGSRSVEKSIANYNSLIAKRNNLRDNGGTANKAYLDADAQIKAIYPDIVASVNNHLKSLQIDRSEIKARLADTDKKIAQLASDQSALDSQMRDHKQLVNQYLYLKGKRSNDPLAINNISEAVRVVAPAASGSSRAPMSLWVGFAIAVVAGFVAVPLLIIFLVNILDTHVRDRYDVAFSGIPYVGEIPMTKKQTLASRIRAKTYGTASHKAPTLVPKQFRDAFMMLRTELNIRFLRHKGTPVCILTSLQPGSGKSYIAINTAAAEAVNGKKVLLIDMDIRCGTLSKRVGSPRKGVAQFLNGTLTDVTKAIVRDYEADIDILPAGSLPLDPAEILDHDSIEAMFAQVRKHYDFIFVDCAPIQLVADTHIISPVADFTLFVARVGLLDRRQLPLIREIYDNNNLPNTMLLLNGTTPDGVTNWGGGDLDESTARLFIDNVIHIPSLPSLFKARRRLLHTNEMGAGMRPVGGSVHWVAVNREASMSAP